MEREKGMGKEEGDSRWFCILPKPYLGGQRPITRDAYRSHRRVDGH